MPSATITGAAIISGTRIILPVDIATIEDGVTIPVTLENATIDVGTIQMDVVVATVDEIIHMGNVDAIGTIDEITGTVQTEQVVRTYGFGEIIGSVITPGTPVQVATVQTIATHAKIQNIGAVDILVGSSTLQRLIIGTRDILAWDDNDSEQFDLSQIYVNSTGTLGTFAVMYQ